MLEILKEIIGLVGRNRVKEIEILDQGILSSKAGKLGDLYQLITDNKGITDKEAKEKLYGDKQTTAYSVLKNDLARRILNNIFFLDIKETSFSTYGKELLNAWRNVTVIQILSAFSMRIAATVYAEKTLNKALNFTFNEIAIICAGVLKNYAAQQGDQKKLIELDAIINECKQIYDLELKVESYYHLIVSNFGNSLTSKRIVIENAQIYASELEPYATKVKSFRFHQFYYKLSALKYSLNGDYYSAIGEFEKLEGLVYQHKRFFQKKIIASANLNKLSCYLHLPNEREGAKTAIAKCLKLFGKGKNNWFIFNELYFLYSMRYEMYTLSFDIFHEVLYHHRFKALLPQRIEKWKIFEAYLNYLIDVGEIPLAYIKGKRKKRFKLEKFLNEVPNLSKDKRGFNIAILIIQVLFLLHQQKYGAIIDKTETLKKYKNTYLKRKEDKRSALFISMLLRLEQMGFDYASNKRSFYVLENELAQTHYIYEGSPDDPEMLPYEKLWDICISLLENQ